MDGSRAHSVRRELVVGRGPAALSAARRFLDAGQPICLIAEAQDDQGTSTRVISVAQSDPERPQAPLRLTAGERAGGCWQQLAPDVVHATRTDSEVGIGKLILVGGGPGPVDLLTVRATKALASADLILLDRLAPRDGLEELAPGAVIMDVGKSPNHHPVPQQQIESEAIAHAMAGATVVRLKGGDPFVFGRGGEELAAARAAGIEVEIVPGVTSAVAVPGAVGIPLTWREISRGFTVISAHAPLSDGELAHLVGLRTTIVCLMGLANLPPLTAGLIRHGMPGDVRAAVIERGFHPSQRSTFSTVADLVGDCARAGVTSPAVIVIGDVVSVASALPVASGATGLGTGLPGPFPRSNLDGLTVEDLRDWTDER